LNPPEPKIDIIPNKTKSFKERVLAKVIRSVAIYFEIAFFIFSEADADVDAFLGFSWKQIPQ
jgi:hypothetical protein